MQHEVCKVYGHLYPATYEMFEAVETMLYHWRITECVEFDGDLLQISFEGICFPVEDTLDIFHSYLTSNSKGKLDILNLEEWTLFRTVFDGKKVKESKVSLNAVLAYSGH